MRHIYQLIAAFKISTKTPTTNLRFTCQLHNKLSWMVLQSYTCDSYKTSNINQHKWWDSTILCYSYGLDQPGNHNKVTKFHYPIILPWSWQSNPPIRPVVLAASAVDCCEDWESCWGRSSKFGASSCGRITWGYDLKIKSFGETKMAQESLIFESAVFHVIVILL